MKYLCAYGSQTWGCKVIDNTDFFLSVPCFIVHLCYLSIKDFAKLSISSCLTPSGFVSFNLSINSHRLMSLLPILSKILEKIVSLQLIAFLECNKLLTSSQYGFKSKLSTETAITTVTNEIYSNMDKKNISLITLC